MSRRRAIRNSGRVNARRDVSRATRVKDVNLVSLVNPASRESLANRASNDLPVSWTVEIAATVDRAKIADRAILIVQTAASLSADLSEIVAIVVNGRRCANACQWIGIVGRVRIVVDGDL